MAHWSTSTDELASRRVFFFVNLPCLKKWRLIPFPLECTHLYFPTLGLSVYIIVSIHSQAFIVTV